jgi:sulfopyruvate decarboxylase subunit beta
MTHLEALQVVAANRAERVVVTTMGSVGLWPAISNSPKDFHYLPSSMGQGVPLGLGLCLSKPGLGVVVVTGDGGLLMNLGCLVTVAQHRVPLAIVLVDNGLYEVTGGQDVVGAGRTDFGALARGAGITRASAFDAIDDWQANAAAYLAGDDPAFVWLKVAGERGKSTPSAPRPMAEQIARLRQAIG